MDSFFLISTPLLLLGLKIRLLAAVYKAMRWCWGKSKLVQTPSSPFTQTISLKYELNVNLVLMKDGA